MLFVVSSSDMPSYIGFSYSSCSFSLFWLLSLLNPLYFGSTFSSSSLPNPVSYSSCWILPNMRLSISVKSRGAALFYWRVFGRCNWEVSGLGGIPAYAVSGLSYVIWTLSWIYYLESWRIILSISPPPIESLRLAAKWFYVPSLALIKEALNYWPRSDFIKSWTLF